MIDKPLTVPELAEHLGVSEDWIYKAARRRQIPFTRIARQLRFTAAHVKQILDDGEQQPVPAPVISLARTRRRRTA